MYYVAYVEWVNEYNDFNKEKKLNFVQGDSYCDAMYKLIKHYGETDIASVKLEPLAPDNVLEFNYDNLEELEVFTEAKRILSENAFW